MNKIRGFEFISQEQQIKDNVTPITLPKRSTSLSAGYDCFSTIDFTLNPGETIKIPTGLKSYMLPGEVLKAYPRSGHGFKYFLRIANTVGIIDADYYNNEGNEGHIWIKLRNEGSEIFSVKVGDAICQFIFEQFLLIDGDSFDNGDVRVGGFGSTGK